MRRLDYFANPNRFMRLSAALLPWMAGLTVILIAVGLYLGLFVAPADYQQGESVRIMYVHVHAASRDDCQACFNVSPSKQSTRSGRPITISRRRSALIPIIAG